MLTRHLRPFLRLAACLAVASPSAPSLTHAANPVPASLASCNAAGCVPANWGPGQSAAGFDDGAFRPGQTFTPKFSGALTEVHLGLQSGSAIAAVVELRATVNGLPAPTILAEAPVAGAPYTPGVLHTANFAAQNVKLFTGTRYAITLRGPPFQVTTILAAFPACPATTSGANDYVHSFDFGQSWSTLPTRDRSIIFEVCLDAATVARADTWGRVKAIYR